MLKKQIKKKQAKNRKKRKGRDTCECDPKKKKKKTRQGQSEQNDCEPRLRLISVEFIDSLPIYKDQIGHPAQLITGAQWQDTKKSNKGPEINERIGYVSGNTLEIKAEFSVENLKDIGKDIGAVTITGNARAAQERSFVFQYEKATLNGEYVTAKEMLVKDALAEKRTRFFDPLTIDWSIKYKIDGLLKTKNVGSSEHQIYVTLDEPSKNLDKLYLSLLHWATSVPGANSKEQAIKNTWSHFANPTGTDDLKTWDKKRTLRYYGTGIDDCSNNITAFLEAPDKSSGGCGVFANLFIETLWVNGIASKCVNVFPPPDNREGMLINNWEPLVDENENFPPEEDFPEYIWKFDFTGEASMYPPPSDNIYEDLESVDGIAGQNSQTPVEKAFLNHFMVKISDTQTANLPYYDPSYGLTYQNKEEFDEDVVFGYFSNFASEGEPDKWWVRRSEDKISEKNLLFELHEDKYPLCGTGPAQK